MTSNTPPWPTTPLPAEMPGGAWPMWWTLAQAPWQALALWQQSVLAMQQEWWDEWVAHWAGGIPLGD